MVRVKNNQNLATGHAKAINIMKAFITNSIVIWMMHP